VIKGVSAIQQNQVRLNGGKQAAYKSPLQIAASHGQIFVILFIECAQTFGAQYPNTKAAIRVLFMACWAERTISDFCSQTRTESQRSFASLRMTIAW
jgi:hypothetical protein